MRLEQLSNFASNFKGNTQVSVGLSETYTQSQPSIKQGEAAASGSKSSPGGTPIGARPSTSGREALPPTVCEICGAHNVSRDFGRDQHQSWRCFSITSRCGRVCCRWWWEWQEQQGKGASPILTQVAKRVHRPLLIWDQNETLEQRSIW